MAENELELQKIQAPAGGLSIEQAFAAAAPDKEKLKAFAAVVRGLQPPELSNQQVAGQLFDLIEELAAWIEDMIPKL